MLAGFQLAPSVVRLSYKRNQTLKMRELKIQERVTLGTELSLLYAAILNSEKSARNFFSNFANLEHR